MYKVCEMGGNITRIGYIKKEYKVFRKQHLENKAG
jgi:hypothetical protein